ncbi:MAG: GatB/YqeY domain-containing protein, partial [Candidatus Bathyarchaeia archaeon]
HRLMKDYGLNAKLAGQIIESEYNALFEKIVQETQVPATTVAAFLTESLKALKRDGVAVENVADKQIKEIFKSVGTGELAKEAIADVFSWLSKNKDKTVKDCIEALELRMLSKEKLAAIVDRVIAENKPLIEKNGKNAFGLVMGLVMKEARGKANPNEVNTLVKQKLAEAL